MQTMGAIDNNQFNSEAAVFPLFVELTNADALWDFFSASMVHFNGF
jgi:hypothetical protein